MNKTNGVATPKLHPDRPKLKNIMTAALLLAMSSTLSSVSHAQTISSTPSSVSHAQTVTVLNTLGTATPRTTFSVFGSSGYAIFREQFAGPPFTLTRRSVLTKVGAFVNNCGQITAGVPQCPNTLPFVVQIRRSVNGAPDPDLLIAAAPLSHDNNPLVVSFESADFDDIPLEAGTYFAIFAPQQATDAGLLLGLSQGYVSSITAVGVVTPTGSTLDTANYAAVQIIARPFKKGTHAYPGK
jgi:hypothetical protein